MFVIPFFKRPPWFKAALITALAAWASGASALSVPVLSLQDAAKKLGSGGYVLLMRHAETTGGPQDPPAARLSDCATQLRLSPAGKEWAGKVGEAFKSAGIRVDEVATSEWCRAKETADLAFGKATAWPALNVFFSNLKRSESKQTLDLQSALPYIKPPKNVVWVSHQVNITALSGFVPAGNEILAVRPVAGKAVAEFRFKPVP